MAHLVRPWKVYYVDKHGKRCPKHTPGARKHKERAAKWYGASIPGYPVGKRIPLATDKTVARQLLAELIARGERGEAGLLDPVAQANKVPLRQHRLDFERFLRSREVSKDHVAHTLSRIDRLLETCGFVYPRDLEADAIMAYLAGRRQLPRKEGGISAATHNLYLVSLGQLCRWMVRKGRLARNPMLDTKTANPRLDRRHSRRALEPGELGRLLQAVAASPVCLLRLDGRDRVALYLTACGTGFRASELAVLTPAAFALDATPPTVTLGATHTKNKRPVVQPLPAVVAAHLRDYLRGRAREQPVWPGRWAAEGNAAKMLKADLEALGIPYVVEVNGVPLYADFHALRHSFVTLLERAGVGAKTAQTLARHGDIRLTLNCYTHADQGALGAALDKLPLPGSARAGELTAAQLQAALVLYATMFGMLLGTLDAHRDAQPDEKRGNRPERAETASKVKRRKAG